MSCAMAVVLFGTNSTGTNKEEEKAAPSPLICRPPKGERGISTFPAAKAVRWLLQRQRAFPSAGLDE
jgi:hypothetical protein